MTIQYPLKFTKSGGAATGFQEFEPGDQITQDLIASLMGRNRIINGTLDIWQRGTNFNFGANQRGYTADRFFARSDDSGSIAISRVDVPTNANAALSPFKSYFSAQVSAGSGAATRQVVSYPIEGVKTLSGGKAALSILMWADAPKNVGVQLYQGFGGGASPNYLTPQVISLTTVPTRYTLVFDVPLVTASFDSTSRLQVVFYLSAGSNYNANSGAIGFQSGTFNFTGLQVEGGQAATDFDFRPHALELLLCQRYYEKSFLAETAPAANVNSPQYISSAFSSTVSRLWVPYKVTKRAPAAVTIYRDSTSSTGSASAANLFNVGAGAWQAANSATSVSGARHDGFFCDPALAWTGAANQSLLAAFNWTADAEL
ncbi:hypothetical protein [Pseudoxanthomonas sp. USHLN014]|uniref:hypothetical protein n=1 Tax=Pseudoxanthomonas sp. USHLN014 TaxID=3081297 RepID=UPI00301D0F43